MSYTITWLNVLGLAAGILILAVGAFVLYARPRGMINRAFFGLALLDGLSNIFFELGAASVEPWQASLFMAAYYHHFIAFTFALLAFGLLFPSALGGVRNRGLILSVSITSALGLLAYTALEPSAWWTRTITPTGTRFGLSDQGLVLVSIFFLTVIAVMGKLGREHRLAKTAREARLSGFFLIGMGLGYAVPFIADVVILMPSSPVEFLVGGPWEITLRHWVELAGALITGLLAIKLARGWRDHDAGWRRVLMGAGGLMVLLVVARTSTSDGFAISQIFALVAYPLILAYAIVTQEAFDINPQVRNAAAVGAAGALFAAGFVIGEDFLQDVLAAGFLGEVASPVAVQAISAVLAAAINLPIFLGARRLAQRAFSGAVVDPKHLGNLATYRLVLEGALEDGILGARESKALKTLREELGISQREHEEIAAQVHASFQDRHASADEPGPTGDPAEGA